MLKEAIEKIRELANKRDTTEVIRLAGEPEHIAHIRTPGSTILETVELEAPNRHVNVHRLEDLTAMAVDHFDPEINGSARLGVFYELEGVSLVFDTANGREQARINLPLSEEYMFFAARLRDPLLSVKELRLACKATLGAQGLPSEHFVEQVKRLDFRNTDGSSAEAGRGASSWSGAVREEVENPGELPDEYVVFRPRIWQSEELNIRLPLSCFLEPDPGSRQWFLRPVEESWQQMIEEAKLALRKRIADQLSQGGEDGPKVRYFEGTFIEGSGQFRRDPAGTEAAPVQ